MENGIRQKLAEVETFFANRKYNLSILRKELESGQFGCQITTSDGTRFYLNGLGEEELDDDTEEMFWTTKKNIFQIENKQNLHYFVRFYGFCKFGNLGEKA